MYLNNIEHPNQLIKEKVNFFADYFQFATDYIEQLDEIEIDSNLTIVERIIFQLESNIQDSSKYLNIYFHFLADKRNQEIQSLKNWPNIKNLITDYKNAKAKSTFLQTSPQLLTEIKLARKELKRIMFKNALNRIMTYIQCGHKTSEHASQIVLNTNILVSEFIVNHWSKNDIRKVFDAVLSSDVSIFPFPKKLLNHSTENATELKEQFLSNRTFKQQFEGLYNLYNGQAKSRILIFPIRGLDVPKDFCFDFDKITFISNKHSRISALRLQFKKNTLLTRVYDTFFKEKSSFLAYTKVKYKIESQAIKEAFKQIEIGLDYLNYVNGTDAYGVKSNWIITSIDFEHIQTKWKFEPHITNHTRDRLNDNIYKVLGKRGNPNVRRDILKHEHLFIRALRSQRVIDYWLYIDALIPQEKKVTMLATILTIQSTHHNKEVIRQYVLSILERHRYKTDHIGISEEFWTEHFKGNKGFNELNLNLLLKNTTNPFLIHLLKLYFKKRDRPELLDYFNFYTRMLTELRAQRNSVLHAGYGDEKTAALLTIKIPRLVARLRWILIERIPSFKGDNLSDLLSSLYNEGNELLHKNNQ